MDNGPNRELADNPHAPGRPGSIEEDRVYCVDCGCIYIPANGRECPCCYVNDRLEEYMEVVEKKPVVAAFKTGDESEFQKPDHDPMGETAAEAAHVSVTCADCGKSGLVIDTVAEVASGMFNSFDIERPIVCAECDGE